ncbi:RacP protein [Streptomyces antarcticus]|uniref:RacP protein n=1 Tax=Streptomyces antarcticus TaxID=2996458 RepID=UPI00227033BB|nr:MULTISPECIES: RacP protein [unclassified Streptomyces]MCY0946557.1 RacP protein [Streptomyces sp. H34-AA3]MCZ4086111.1 RacP protein [Streptomyces sp. H34-S5]
MSRRCPVASERKSPAAQRHADTVRYVLFEARPAGLTFDQLVRASALTRSQARSGLACLRDIITERGWPPLIWLRAEGYKFCSDPVELQFYEVAVIREKLTEIRRFLTSVVAHHATLQPKGRWIKHLNTQLNSVESTLDVIAATPTPDRSPGPAAFGGRAPNLHR